MFLPPPPRSRKPRRNLGDDQDDANVNVLSETKALLFQPSALLLCIIYAWVSGGFVAWNSLFNDLLSGLWSDDFIGALTLTSTISYVVGGSIAAILVDSKLRSRMRAMLIASCALSTVTCTLLLLSVPSVFSSGNTLIIKGGDAWLFVVFLLCGFANGSAAPVFYELMAEITHPISEGVSGNVLSYFENAGALILYQGVGNVASGRAMNVIFALGMGCAAGGLTFVKQALHRHKYEVELRGGLADVDTFDPHGDSERMLSTDVISTVAMEDLM
jgi:FLVCR family MFS transporter